MTALPKLVPFAVLLGLFGIAGCSARTAEFSGRVTYRGQPVYRGAITIEGEDKTPLVAAIGEDGSFQFPKVPPGTYKVGVLCPEPSKDTSPGFLDPANKRREMPGADGDPNSAKRWIKIPARSGNPDQSGVSVEIVAPATNKEIQLID